MHRLAGQTSPYLRRHADNPVDWFPWGTEAFTRPRELMDNAAPRADSLAACALVGLGALTSEDRYRQVALATLAGNSGGGSAQGEPDAGPAS